jgi:hypothetical protein
MRVRWGRWGWMARKSWTINRLSTFPPVLSPAHLPYLPNPAHLPHPPYLPL